MENEQVKIEYEEIKNLVKEFKPKVSSMKKRLFLGVFDRKIPVLLCSPHKDLPEFPIFFNEFNEIKYRIHYNDPDQEWWISPVDSDVVLFTFHIPTELKKILAKTNDPARFANLKQQYMSSLTFTQRIGNEAIVYKLNLDSHWISEVLQNVRLALDE